MLSKSKLKNELVENYNKTRDDGDTSLNSAKGMANAIVSFASDAQLPAAANSSIKTAQVGQPALQSGIMSSYNLQDPAMSVIATAIVTYVTTSFTTFVTGTNSGIGVCVMTVPPIFAPVTAVGMGGGSIEQCMDTMANVIYTSFKSVLFTGTVILSGAAGAAVTSMPIL